MRSRLSLFWFLLVVALGLGACTAAQPESLPVYDAAWAQHAQYIEPDNPAHTALYNAGWWILVVNSKYTTANGQSVAAMQWTRTAQSGFVYTAQATIIGIEAMQNGLRCDVPQTAALSAAEVLEFAPSIIAAGPDQVVSNDGSHRTVWMCH